MNIYRFLALIFFIQPCLEANAQNGLYLQHGSTFVINEEASLYINGGLFLEDESFLANNGTVILSGNGPAHFTDHSKKAYAYGKGRFIFNSSAAQLIESLNQFEEIFVNNKGLGLKSNITSGKWILINGIINTGPFYSIVKSPGAEAIQAGIGNTGFSQSWFNGNLRRYIKPAGFNSYIFPVGNAESAYAAELDSLAIHSPATVNYMDASFSAPSLTYAASDKEKGIFFINQPIAGIWHIIPQKEITKVSYNLRLVTGENSLANTEYTIVTESGNRWLIPPGSIVVQEEKEKRGYISRNHISNFTTFSIFQYAGRPQPIQMAVFPNPVTDYRFIIELTGDDNKIINVKLFAPGGKEQKISAVSVIKENRLQISVPQSCTKGVYTLIVGTPQAIKTSKLIIL